MSWSIKIFRHDSKGFSVMLDGIFFNPNGKSDPLMLTWDAGEPEKQIPLPAPYADMDEFEVYAVSFPYNHGTSSFIVMFGETAVQTFEFTKGENHTVHKP